MAKPWDDMLIRELAENAEQLLRQKLFSILCTMPTHVEKDMYS